MATAHVYRWHILLVLGFFLLTTMTFFAFASRDEEKIQIIEPEREKLTEPTISFIDPSKGSAEAAITIVEFGDFACEPCAQMATTLASLQQQFPEDVRVIWKDFPNESLHDQATPAALAARCAQDQGAFWAYHDELFLRQSRQNDQTYLAIAQDLELNVGEFQNCYNTQESLPLVKRSFDEGLALDLKSTPTLFIEAERLTGAVTLRDLEAIVRQLLATQ